MKYITFVFVLLSFPIVSLAQRATADVSFIENVPESARCLSERGCWHEANRGVVVRPGGKFSYSFLNLERMSFVLESEADGMGKVISFSTSFAPAACADAADSLFAPVESYAKVPVLGDSWDYAKWGAVCFRWVAGLDSLIILSLYEAVLDPNVVSGQIALYEAGRVAQLVIERYNAGLETKTKEDLTGLLPRLRRDHDNALIRTSSFYVAATNTQMAVSLSRAVGALNQSANPTLYKEFKAITDAMKEQMDKKGTQVLQLERTLKEFQATRNRPFSWLKGGLDLVEGVLGATPFGVAAGSLRSMLAGVFDRGQLALQRGGFGLQLEIPVDPKLKKDLEGKVGKLDLTVNQFINYLRVQTRADEVAELALKGVEYYQRMDSLLNGLEMVNAEVNYFNGLSENVRVVAIDNQRDIQSIFEELLKLAGSSCEALISENTDSVPTDARQLGPCDRLAWAYNSRESERDSVLSALDTYYKQLNDRVNNARDDELKQVSGEIQRLEVDVKALLEDGEAHQEAMVSGFEAFIKQLIVYLTNGNPFEKGNEKCLPSKEAREQPSPYCAWRRMTHEPVMNLEAAYRSYFGHAYKQ